MSKSNVSLLPNLMNSILEEIDCNYKKDNNFADNDLLLLYNIFGNVAEKAFELVEKDTVKKMCLENSTRSIYQVTGSSNKSYYIFPDINYCQCPAYCHFVSNNRSQLTCKHVLACRLCIIMNKLDSYEINLTEFMDIQKTMINSKYVSNRIF